MRNYLSPSIDITEVILYCYFSVKGKTIDMPEEFYRDDISYQLNNLCDIEDDINSFARPLVSSFYCHSSHFTGGGGYFEGSLEEFWEDTFKSISGIKQDYQNYLTDEAEDEFIEDYSEEVLSALKFIGDTDIGVVYDTKVERGRLSVHMYFGDCSVGGDNTSDIPGYFSKEDMPGVEYLSHLEELDRGEVPECYPSIISTELSNPVLIYSLGKYLVWELVTGDDRYSDNITETLYNIIKQGVNTEDLCWCELQGSEVTNKWVELVECAS